jgi:hypothetical protein
MKDVGGNDLGSEDQDFGRGKNVIKQNPISHFSQNQGELGHPQFILPTGSVRPASKTE